MSESNTTAEGCEHAAQFFTYQHLPPHLQEVSKHFAELAELLQRVLPANRSREQSLELLVQAKDAAVRARLAK